MKGWQIVKHSLRQVFGNLGGALRVSIALYLVQVVIGFLLGVGSVLSMGAGMSPDSAGWGIFLVGLLVVAVVVFTGLWIAVAWHRYVLLGEEVAVVPTLRGDRIGAYFLRSLGYAVILVIIGVLWGLVVGFLFGGFIQQSSTTGIFVMGFVVYLPIAVLAFRMTADLPGAALGADHPFGAGFSATAGHTKDIVVMALILVVLAVGIELLAAFIFGRFGILAAIWQIVYGWVQMMVGVSVLTTLYGHYIEKRELV